MVVDKQHCNDNITQMAVDHDDDDDDDVADPTECVFFQTTMPSACDSMIDDIEDMVSASDPTPQDRQNARKSVIPRARKRKGQLVTEELQADRSVLSLML